MKKFKVKKGNVNTPDFWDQQFKEEYDFITGEAPTGYWRWFLDRFELIAREIEIFNGKVLDVGCGLGHLVRYLNARMPMLEVVGTDFSKFAVDATIKFGHKAFVSDCYNFSESAENYDYVIASEVIEHIDYPKKLLKESKKALRKGGKCIITTPVKGRYECAHDHVKEFSMEELESLMKKEFDSVKVHDYNHFQLVSGIKK